MIRVGVPADYKVLPTRTSRAKARMRGWVCRWAAGLPAGPPGVVPFASTATARWSAVSRFSDLSCFGHELKQSPFLRELEGTPSPHTLVLGSSDSRSGFPRSTFLRAGGPGPLLPCRPPPGPSSKTVWTAILRVGQCGVKKQSVPSCK